MKVGPYHLLGAAAAAVGLAFLFSGEEDGEGAAGEEDEGRPRVGFAPTLEQIFVPHPPDPVDLEQWEDAGKLPTIGTFFQVPRKFMLLGTGKKSVTWMALYRAANFCLLSQGASVDEAHRYAERTAHNGDMRSEYGNLILASSWNDELYGTWGYGRRCPVGPHGRGIPFEACHADNRARLLAGRPPARQIPLGSPEDRGSGSAIVSTGRSRPYLWLPMINLDEFLRGIITTRGVVWPGDRRISGIDPPPEFWAFGMEGV